jgi:hypothetical protein
MPVDLRDLAISHSAGSWQFGDHLVRAQDTCVIFMNDAMQNCQIIFSDPTTFGTAMLCIGAGGILSVNILNRNKTMYGVQNWGTSGPLVSQHTIEVNSSGQIHKKHKAAKV